MFVNTRLFSPVVLEGYTQAPRGTYEWIEWWKEQRRRCIDGYTVGDVTITGPHYWYLNFWKIRAKVKGGSIKRLINPRFTDLDYDFFHILNRARNIEKVDLMVLKARQKGFSNKYGAIGGHEFTFVPDSQTVVVAGEEKFAKTTFGMIRQGLNEMSDSEFYKNKLPNTSSLIRAAYKKKVNGVEREAGFMSTARYLTSDGDPQTLISLSPSFVIYEEVGKFPGFLDVLAYIRPAMRSEGEKTGFNLLVGTGGEPGDAIRDFGEAFYNPEKYGLLAIDRSTYDEEIPFDDSPKAKKKTAVFYGAHRYLKVDDEGNSLIPESVGFILNERKKVEGNDKVWLTVTTQDPLTPEEALMTPAGNVFNIRKLREVLLAVDRLPFDPVQTGDLFWKEPGNPRAGVYWEPSPSGPIRITEHPKVDPTTGRVYTKLYVGGTDSYDKDQTASSYGSFGSCHIFKRFLDASDEGMEYVAHYFDRPETSREFFETTAKLMVYYGWAQNLIEHSNVAIMHWYEANSFTHLLRERPEVAYASQISAPPPNRFGIDPMTKPYWITSMQDYVEKYAHKLKDRHLIQRLIDYKIDPDYNCDTTISASLCQVHERDLLHTPVQREVKKTVRMRRFVVINGKMQAVMA